jgi:hypothetical protein
MLTVLPKVITRIAIGFAASVAALVAVGLLGVFGGSGGAGPLTWMWGLLAITYAGWSLLPLVRHSKQGWYVSAAIWIAIGIYLGFFFAVGSRLGSAGVPWLVASLILGGMLATNPPPYSQLPPQSGEASNVNPDA